MKKRKRRPETPIEVHVTYGNDEAAEDRFWKLYLEVALDHVLKGKKPKKRGRRRK